MRIERSLLVCTSHNTRTHRDNGIVYLMGVLSNYINRHVLFVADKPLLL